MKAVGCLVLGILASVAVARPVAPMFPASLVPAAPTDAPAASVDDVRAAIPVCAPARRPCFAVQLHVARTVDGLIASPTWIVAQVAQANHHFATLGVGFQLAGVAELPAAYAHLADRTARNALATHVKGRVIHVFITGRLDDVDTPDVQINGVAWRKGGPKYIIVSTIARDRTLAHELGHVFGLPHSSYPISLMNKTPRSDPPPAERTFAPEEIAVMKRAVARMILARVLVDLASP